MLRRILLAASFVLGLALPAFGQAPPAVPALPDTQRRTSYNISGSTCACAVGFAIYGDGSDVDNWVQVYIGTTRYLSTDPGHGWTLTSPTGPIANIPRPITDAVLTFGAAQTGNINIFGARRPRRLSQFPENRGVTARDFNQALTDIVAQNRENWDKIINLIGVSDLPPAAGQLIVGQGVTNPAAWQTASGDVCSITAGGVFNNCQVNTVPFASSYTTNLPLVYNGSSVASSVLSVLGGGTGSVGPLTGPLIGNAVGPFTAGTFSGNTTTVATVSGPTTSGRCINWDGAGNIVSGSGACVSSGSGVSAGTAGQLAYYASSGSVVSGYVPPAVDAGNIGVVCDGTDQSAHLNSFLTSKQLAGTGATILFRGCTYVFTNPILLPNTNSPYNAGANPSPTQVTFVFQGAGAYAKGQIIGSVEPFGFGGTVFDLQASDPLGHIQTYGFGLFQIENITFARSTPSNGINYIYSTYTTIWAKHDAFIGDVNKCGNPSTQDQDAFVLGGTNPSQAAHTVDNPYQGYGTVLEDIWFDHMRRAVYSRLFSNHLVGRGLTVWSCGGSNLIGANGFSSVGAGGAGYSVGNILTVSGGTLDTHPRGGGQPATVIVDAVSAGVVTAAHVYQPGDYTTAPTNPVSVTGGGGAGATFNLVWGFDGVAFEDQDVNGTNAADWNIQGFADLCGYSYVGRTNDLYGVWQISGDDFNVCSSNHNIAVMHFSGGAQFNVLMQSNGTNGIPNAVDNSQVQTGTGSGPVSLSIPCGTNNVLQPNANGNLGNFQCINNVYVNALTVRGLSVQSDGSHVFTIQPLATQGSTTPIIQQLSSVADGSAVIFQSDYRGTLTVGPNSQGLISPGGSSAAFTSNWRTWTNQGNGQTMTIEGANITLLDNTATKIVNFGGAHINFGSAGDAALARTGPGQFAFGNFSVNSTNGNLTYALWTPGIVYSAAGTALPACNGSTTPYGTSAVVSDATAPTYRGAYTSGSNQYARVMCNSSNSWITN
jgi:hypothetical protein